MKRMTALLLALLLIPALASQADNRDGGRENDNAKPARPEPAARAPQVRQAPAARQPVVINMSQGTSGGHNRNFPSQQPSQPAAQPESKPSYSRLNNWTAPAQNRVQSQPQPWTPANRNAGLVNHNFTQAAPRAYQSQRPDVQAYASPGVRAAVAVHHHAYTPGYIRGKLKKIGVTAEPNVITNRAEMLHTDRAHSAIGLPRDGPDHGLFHPEVISSRHFNDPVVRQQMGRIDNADWTARIHGFKATENQANHYYWHQDQGFNYCHYIDP